MNARGSRVKFVCGSESTLCMRKEEGSLGQIKKDLVSHEGLF